MNITKQTTLGELIDLMHKNQFFRIHEDGDWQLRENWLDSLIESGLLKDGPSEAVKISPEQEEKLRELYLTASKPGTDWREGFQEGIEQTAEIFGITLGND